MLTREILAYILIALMAVGIAWFFVVMVRRRQQERELRQIRPRRSGSTRKRKRSDN